MKFILRFLLLIFALSVLSSCLSRNEGMVSSPEVTATTVKSKIVIQPWPGTGPTYKVGDILDFQIKNISSETIKFDRNFGVKILQKGGTDWIPVKNGEGYPEVENILHPDNINPGGLSLFVFPKLDSLQTQTIIRIEINGYVENDPTNIVTTYVDVLYNP
jgi:hypothetical protein